jgi:phospholipase C
MRPTVLHFLVTILVAGGCDSPDQGPRSTLTAEQAAAARQACMFEAGTQPGLSIAKTDPLGTEIPIDTIVVLMMENRPFDHLLSNLPATGQPDVDVAAADVSNADSKGNAVKRFHLTDYCFDDTNHEWSGTHLEFNGGKNDGFVVANENFEAGTPDGTRAMGFYDQTDLPFIYGAANAYAISDRHFASVLGPTFPNREYLYAATSYGHTTNSVFTSGHKNNIIEVIQTHNMAGKDPLTWHIYYEGVPGFGVFIETLTAYLDNVSMVSSMNNNFFDDAAAGNLSNVNFIDANLRDEWGGNDDYHPPGDVQVGDQFIAKVVDAVTHGPQWKHLALIITFDEHGGIYDHVAPPKACPPDDIAPMVGAGETVYDFANYGIRVPLIIVSPYAKPHYVSHVVTDHTSITRFIERRFKLPAMTKRDANADPLLDLFDFNDLFDFKNAKLLTPPPLPTATVDQAKLQACMDKYPLHSINFLPDMVMPADMGTTD